MSALIPNQKVNVLDGVAGLMSRAWFVFLTTLTKLPSERLSGAKTYDPPNILDGASAATTVTVPGALLSAGTPMAADACFSLPLLGLTLTAYVNSADTVSVVFSNTTGGAVDLGSGTLTAFAWRP